jgi:two-component system cell cycle response regulator
MPMVDLKVEPQMSIPKHIMERTDPESEMSDKPPEKQRLLIVDDSKVIRVTARKILRDHFEIIEAVDGENAWEVVSGNPPVSLVVSDLTMPKLDGFGLLKRIRNSQLPYVREVPVIIITGANDTEATMAQAREAGATDFIGKPFDAVHLLARTQAHANSHAVTNTLMKKNTALEEKSTTDPLTGLANEAAFMERGYQQLSYAIRHNQRLTVLRIEIDGYGAIFRKYGKSFSESIIQTLANILGTSIRQEDTVARTGTARFALLLPGMDRTGLQNLVERIKNGVSRRVFRSGNDKTTVTVSIGVASPEIRRDMRLNELVTAADEHLSLAISAGGDQVVYETRDGTSTAAWTGQAGLAGLASNTPASIVLFDRKAATPAGAAGLFHGDDMEVEEIEIFSPGFPYNHFSGANGKAADPGQRRSTADASHVSSTYAEPLPVGETVAPAADSTENEHGIPEQMPPAPTRTGNFLSANSGAGAETGMPPCADDEDAAMVPALLIEECAAESFGETVVAEAIPMPAQAKKKPHTGKPGRVRRPGVLKRTLAWLGLIRSQE